jgi:Cu-Zn family superoxide dismutase
MGEPNSIYGKAIVVHASADDQMTDPSGASGARIACGVVPAMTM